MTVMFCDLVDSTPLAEALDAEDFREVLTDYRQACTQAVERFGGYIAVYAGDGMTVYFGYPRAHEDDAHRAVYTGLAILDGIADLNARLQDLYDISIQLRIGVHSGVVIAEELGGGDAETRSQLDVSGEMPHIAARIESAAPPGSICISDATLALVHGYFDSEALGEKALKGVSRPVGVHRILGPTGAVGRLQVTAAQRLTPVVGRNFELAQLTEAWRRATSGHGAVTHVTGDAGIGKSRLVHELALAVGDEPCRVETWQCSAHHQGTSLYPVITFLERLSGSSATDRADGQLEQALAAARLEATDATANLTPRGARTASLHVLESLLVADPDRHPLLLVVEDLHWADPTTMELLGRIIRGLRDKPVLCVLTFRSGFKPPWSDKPFVLEIQLGPLTPGEVRAMAAAASGDSVDPSVLEWVESTADGVPLFVEEMLKAGPAPAASGVPPTLEGLLTERLDRLPEFGDLIDTAAILGREFDRSLLAALEPLEDGDVDPALTQLTEQDVLRPVIGAPGRYEFTHGLLHEAAYGRILRRHRRALHARVAETLVESFPDTVAREPELVAQHWAAADKPTQAVTFWHAAGRRALERASYLEAAEHFRRGVDALDAAGAIDDLQQVDFLTHIGASLQAGRGYAAAGVGEAYARARSACERVSNDERLGAIIHGQWMFHLLRGDYGTALERADEMLALAQRTDGSVPPAEGHLDRGLVHMYLGEFDLAREHLEQAFAQYQPRRQPDLVYDAQGDTGVGALAYLAIVLWNLGFAQESLERSELSLERAEHVGGPVTRAQAWGMRSILHLSRAEPVELGNWLRRTHAHSIDHDLGYWRTVSALLGGWLQGRSGAIQDGLRRLQTGLDAYTSSGSRLGLPHFHILIADLKRAAGDTRGAFDLLRAAEDYIAESGERLSESELFRFKGRLFMAGDSPDPDAATAAFGRAVATAREQHAKLLELQAVTRLAEHQQKLGEPCSALDRVAELSDWFGRDSDLMDVARARALVTWGTMAR